MPDQNVNRHPGCRQPARELRGCLVNTGEQPGDDLTTVDVSDGGTDSPDSGQDASLGEATEDAADAGQDTAAADS